MMMGIIQCGNGDAKPCLRGDKGFGYAVGQQPCVADAEGGDEAERVDHACDGSQQAEQRGGGGADSEPEEKMVASCNALLRNGEEFILQRFAVGGGGFGGGLKSLEVF